MDPERRRAPRYRIIADAEVTSIASDRKFSAKTSDLSSGGCFLDMSNPPPQGAEIIVKVLHAGTTFTSRGKVVFVFPNSGMGVMFTSFEADQQAVLERWLSELRVEPGQRTAKPSTAELSESPGRKIAEGC